MQKWRVSQGRIVAPDPSGRVWLLDEDGAVCFDGIDAEVLVRLDDATPESALLKDLPPTKRERVQSSLYRLEAAGIVEKTLQDRKLHHDAALLPPPLPFDWIPLTEVGQQSLATLFSASGFELSSAAPRVLVTTDDYLSREVLDIASRETRPWLLARTVGRGLIIGPAFKPGSLCWSCFAYWLRSRRWRQAAALDQGEQTALPQPAIASVPALMAAVNGHVTLAVLRWVNGSVEFDGRFRYFDLPSGASSAFEVTPRAGCGCTPPKPVDLENWANPVTGIVFNLSIASERPGGLYEARARHLRPFPSQGARPLLEPGTVYGGGATPRDARVRCIAEGLERWSCVWQGDEPTVMCRAEELDRVVMPVQLSLHSKRQWDQREAWNRSHRSLFHVPEPLDPELGLEWVEFRSLASQEKVYVPAACSYMWHTSLGGINFGYADSNGCAAGQTMGDAVLGGLLELVERDAVSIWWDNRLLRPAIDWIAFGDSELLRGVEDLHRRGRLPVLLDLTTDLRIPVYAAVACREDGSQPYVGCAAHVDPLRAAQRAFAELVQNWFWSSLDPEREIVEAWAKSARPETHAYLFPRGRTSIENAFAGGPTKAALQFTLDRLVAVGIEAHWLDLTRPDIGVPVCRVIAPGLRHCWMRHASGRLFDVPVKLGWLPRALTEDELNPEGCPL